MTNGCTPSYRPGPHWRRAGAAGLVVLAASVIGARAVPTLLFQAGLASVYVDRQVYCPGERYDASVMTAAHRTIPCGARIKVTNRRSGKSVVLRVTDRGPHVAGRIVDLTPAAAQRIDLDGLGLVTLEQLD